jgi:hypothetical protein
MLELDSMPPLPISLLPHTPLTLWPSQFARVCAESQHMPGHLVRTLLLAVQSIHMSLPHLSPSKDALYVDLLSGATTLTMPAVLDIIVPYMKSAGPSALPATAQGRQHSGKRTAGRAARLQGATGNGLQPRPRTPGQGSQREGQVVSEQLSNSIDLWGLMHSCCSVINRGCHMLVNAGVYLEGERCRPLSLISQHWVSMSSSLCSCVLLPAHPGCSAPGTRQAVSKAFVVPEQSFLCIL